MQLLASLADQCVTCLKERNYVELAKLIELNFMTRRRLYSDEVVGKKNIELFNVAKSKNLSAKFTGSGGAFVCIRNDGEGW